MIKSTCYGTYYYIEPYSYVRFETNVDLISNAFEIIYKKVKILQTCNLWKHFSFDNPN